ncbi:hypothetical protein FACS1894211_00560 [Clostridia bacterium]|nr:hypothetical protein FACS1894211_00560 [Clostridia bacterium]
MDNLLQIVSVPVITAVVYGAMELYKHVANGNEKFIRLIPVTAIILGAVLGVVAFYAAEEVIAADNVFTAILIGGASGSAATGGNQIIKQLLKGKEDKGEKNE